MVYLWAGRRYILIPMQRLPLLPVYLYLPRYLYIHLYIYVRGYVTQGATYLCGCARCRRTRRQTLITESHVYPRYLLIPLCTPTYLPRRTWVHLCTYILTLSSPPPLSSPPSLSLPQLGRLHSFHLLTSSPGPPSPPSPPHLLSRQRRTTLSLPLSLSSLSPLPSASSVLPRCFSSPSTSPPAAA
ncbi:hypothetical protein GGS23DRAFT_553945 [Durotheca rogersii]|uniref:uncharacterized protein n=1 Tax=Durotheca rogersii TaxID=419775 RepID=UPI0022210CE7|nr:uncharacterized protein GGS23DRAFT_553945 [Durotheca rogersii]KAI5865727.1 hypothetical protein GGS23DRAFT_553945 [Durotheca rogersii]